MKTLVDLLCWRGEVAPGDRGFRFLVGDEEEGERRSFAELDKRARAIGAALAEEMDPGDRALLLFPPSLDYVEAFFGCLYAGVIAVPAYPPDPSRLARTVPRLQAIVDDAGARMALTTKGIARMAAGLATQAPRLLELAWVATDEIDDGMGSQWVPPGIDGETVAFLQYTSGSTGSPRGVVLDHETLLKNEELIQGAFQSSEDHVGVHWLPLYHDMGLIGAVIQPVYCGCESVLMSPLDFLKKPARWVKAISRFGGNISTAPNFAFDLAVRKTSPEVRDGLDLSTWRVACNGAEPVRAATMRRFAAYFEPAGFDPRAFMPAYGLAEVGLIVSATPAFEPYVQAEVEGEELVSSGRLLGDFEARIVDPEAMTVAGDGEVGELWLRGGSVARGYWEKPEKNEEVFGARLPGEGDEPWLRTGDLAALIDGELLIAGRLKDLIVIRGKNFYPQDIEAAVEGVKGIRRGCVAAFSVDRDEEGLVVVAEVDGDGAGRASEVLAAVHRRVVEAYQVVPADVVLIQARTIEKTSSGKIQRFASKRAYEAGTLTEIARTGGEVEVSQAEAAGMSPRRGEIEAWLVERVAEACGLPAERVGRRAPFASFGLDSVEAVGIVGELEEWLGESLAATALFEYPTIQALGAFLAGEEVEGAREDVPGADVTGSVASEAVALAVVGVACRFPGADDVDGFFEELVGGETALRDVPSQRWEPRTFTDPELAGFDTIASDKGGFLEDLEGFDAAFFGLSPREARAMDPQQRLILECAWLALEDAGLSREALAGSSTGVFVGQSGSDFARLYEGPPVRAASGLAPSITANRLSYWLDLQGPSVVVDTACSSSLVALDQALLNLRARRCDTAIVGGVNVILAPDMSVAFSQAGMLSPSGELRAFDAGADGYVRGEGCGVVVVKRLEDAVRDGDQIRAVIRGGAVNQDGQTNGLTAPSGAAQQAVIEAALRDAGVEAESIGAIEAHGTGTELGDAIEARALGRVFGEAPGVGPEGRRWLGSVKAQIGHLEAGAGMAGLIKAILMVERGVVPPQVAFETPNAACGLEESGLSVAQEALRWPGLEESGVARRVGVSSFGFGGTNAHMIVEEPPAGKQAGVERTVTTYDRRRLWPRDGELRRQAVGSKGEDS